MEVGEVARYWDENAEAWSWAVRVGLDAYRDHVVSPAFFGLFGDIEGINVLDIGCGEGTETRKLAQLGARVTGIDISMEMLKAAITEEKIRPLGIAYDCRSGNSLGIFGNHSFDMVVSTMALMDVEDYRGCVREVSRVLHTDGVFQFSVFHPCTMTRVHEWVHDSEGRRSRLSIGNYFGLEEGTPDKYLDECFFHAVPAEVKRSVRWFRVPRFFRTLSDYINPLVENGLLIERVEEPVASEEAVKACPGVRCTRIVPVFLILRCRKL